MRRKAIEESRRLENDQRMRKNLIGRAAGIDLDNDCEQARQHVRFARRAEIEKAVATDSCEPGVPPTAAKPIPINFHDLRERLQTPSELDESLVALAPAIEYFEFFDEASLSFDYVMRQNRGLRPITALSNHEEDRVRAARQPRYPQALPKTSIARKSARGRFVASASEVCSNSRSAALRGSQPQGHASSPRCAAATSR
jgi:hypothetical protein